MDRRAIDQNYSHRAAEFKCLAQIETNRMREFKMRGYVLTTLGHRLSWFDKAPRGLYLPDCFAGRLQKFEPIPGADPDKVAGQILRTWDTWKP